MRLDNELARFPRVPSLVVTIVRPFGESSSITRGLVSRAHPVVPDERTRFRIGSITKVLTALAILALQDDRALSVEDPVELHVPELTKMYPSTAWRRASLRHLISHSAGMPRLGGIDYTAPGQGVTPAAFLADLSDLRLLYEPGTRAAYSNIGMAVAGLVVERASKRPYREFMQQRLISPLGMDDCAWDERDVPTGTLAAGHWGFAGDYVAAERTWRLGAMEAMGGLFCSSRDLVRFAVYQLKCAVTDPAGPMRPATVRGSHRALSPGGPPGFGAGWLVEEDLGLGRIIAHTGSTSDYAASLVAAIDRGSAVIALASAGESEVLERLAHRVLELVTTR